MRIKRPAELRNRRKALQLKTPFKVNSTKIDSGWCSGELIWISFIVVVEKKITFHVRAPLTELNSNFKLEVHLALPHGS